MAEQDAADAVHRLLDAVGHLHAEVLQLFGELRALRAETQELRGDLRLLREDTQHARHTCGELREGQRTLETQSALQADALRLIAGVVHRLAEALRRRWETPGDAPED